MPTHGYVSIIDIIISIYKTKYKLNLIKHKQKESKFTRSLINYYSKRSRKILNENFEQIAIDVAKNSIENAIDNLLLNY